MNKHPWWRSCTCYQIYLPSFCDGNGDGMGDFPGLLSKVEYLHALGVGAIWITPFYPSPLVDNGYDISDYCDVDPRFGTLADFREVVERCHACGIRVIIDLVVNHVSSQHPWFRDAWNNPASRYRDYFLFSKQPNNWQSFFSGSAWCAEPDTGEYYYHKFAPQQVDLNWQNPQVEQEIYRVIDFWKAQGVDGFRFDVINFLTTDGIGPDNPVENGEQQHRFDINQPGIIDTLTRLCRYVRQQASAFLIAEIGSDELDDLVRYQAPELMDVVFNFNIGSQKTFDISRLCAEINATQSRQSGPPTLFFSSHDMPRMIGRFGDGSRDIERARAVLALQLTVRGVPFIFQGEELGMTNYHPKTVDQLFDIQGITHYQTALQQGLSAEQALAQAIEHSRDASRAPMLWSDAPFAGFSCVPPWMPVSEDYLQINATQQRQTATSLWRDYQTLITLRAKSEALCIGECGPLSLTQECVWFTRTTGNERLWVAINFGEPIENPWWNITADLLYGQDGQWLGKNQILIKGKFMNRHSNNPLITPKEVVPSLPGRKVECVFNTGVTEYQGEIILLLRVAESVVNDDPRLIVVPLLEPHEGGWRQATKTFDRGDDRYDFSDPRTIVLKSDPAQLWLTSMSHLRLARSQDGVHYTIDSEPFIIADSRYEEFGCEDARITQIDGLWYINYSAVSSLGITTALATTRDFVHVEKQGLIFCPDNRDVCFFPEKVAGRYMALTRPAPSHFGHPEIWICESPDMLHWGNHRHLLGRSGDEWDSRKSGGGAPLIKTDRGWLEIYHGVDADQRYCLGALLLDLNDPTKILAKSPVPLLEPTATYEREGFFGNVVFTCGALVRNETLHVWYGAADECTALATLPMDALWKHLGLA